MNISKIIKQLVVGGAVAAVVVACATSGASEMPKPLPELAGRTAGAPQRCVATQLTGAMRIAAPQVILYGSGQTIWVNRLSSPCPGMDRKGFLIVEPFGAQYCRGDRVRNVEPVSRIPGPVCILGDFVSYTR